VLLGQTKEELGASEYLNTIHGMQKGPVPDIDLNMEAAVQKAVLQAIEKGIIASAHDCSDGGLAVALAECCISGKIGADIALESHMRLDALLFGESQSRIIVSLESQHMDELKAIARAHGIPYEVLGTVGGDELKIAVNGASAIQLSVERMAERWENTIPAYMNTR